MTAPLTPATGDVVLVEDASGVRTLTLNRPHRRNALDEELVDRCRAEFERADQDPDVKVIVLTGAGTSFCAGGDLGTVGEDRTAAQQKDFVLRHVFGLSRAIRATDKPVIAAVNGPAAGTGVDLALLCDLRFAAERAVFTEAYVRVGVPPGDGGAWLLPRVVGVACALDLLWTGRAVTAAEARAIGLVDHVSPDHSLMWDVLDYGRRLAAGPQLAIRMIKRLVYQGLETDLATHIDQVSSHMAIVRESADFREGLAAFRERRDPRFL